jgi:hypothetical protein
VNTIRDWALRVRWSSGLRQGQPVAVADDEYLGWRIRRPASTRHERAERAAAMVVAAELGELGELGPLDLRLVLEQLAIATVIATGEAA